MACTTTLATAGATTLTLAATSGVQAQAGTQGDDAVAYASRFAGVPYVYGGTTPSGFDCSGFIMFVYAQYGVSLPHSVHAQDGIGTHISPEDAQVGDVVVFNDDSHDGFYAGNGMILHAPYPGARVRVQKLWTSDVHFVRFGI